MRAKSGEFMGIEGAMGHYEELLREKEAQMDRMRL